MCYLSHLASGRSRRLMILVRLRGCEGLDDLWHIFPDDLILLRQSATAAQCSIDRRQRSVQQAGHLPLFATGSPQLTLEDVGEIADQFLALVEHKLAAGMAARFHADMMAFPADRRKEELLNRSNRGPKVLRSSERHVSRLKIYAGRIVGELRPAPRRLSSRLLVGWRWRVACEQICSAPRSLQVRSKIQIAHIRK